MLGPLVIVDNLVNQICVCKDLLLALLKSFLQSLQKQKKSFLQSCGCVGQWPLPSRALLRGINGDGEVDVVSDFVALVKVCFGQEEIYLWQ
jgi:hypothetical protein